MLPLCKFYRYLIYRLYHFRDDTPEINVVGTLTIVHLVQILGVLFFVDKFTSFKVWPDWTKYNPTICVILFGVLNFLLLYNKKKWKSYDKEFKDESARHKRNGTIVVLAYLIGTIVLFWGLLFSFSLYQDSLK